VLHGVGHRPDELPINGSLLFKEKLSADSAHAPNLLSASHRLSAVCIPKYTLNALPEVVHRIPINDDYR
jgi:hypothetical protein